MSAARKVLLVEDDEAQANWAKLVLTRGRFDVTHCQTGGQAIRAMTKEVPDAVVLDMRLPDVHGLEVLVWIRRNFFDVPVIVLSNAMQEMQIVEAFSAGADDYVLKPAREAEFLARIAAMMRRKGHAVSGTIEIGGIAIDLGWKAVRIDGEPVRMAPIEYEILEMMARHLGSVVQREVLVNRIWGRSIDEAVSRSLDTHVYRIRHKLKVHGVSNVSLRSVYNLGYRLEWCRGRALADAAPERDDALRLAEGGGEAMLPSLL
ncbi:response regulator transcription factor [Burkholderia pseudomallei]|uniref:response regulator transcription factor n=1 Tax=Burkholderia pseudomallei TaxID=28450 RepID=UPI00016B1F70|nr:response regulator transcription factor [Burkholderia pseudomallei]AGZ28520.1 LOW QUALITY PROTEIN: transcriptional regulatory, C terminal family protein [Burkholderia pseudomallei NCTC 13179]KGC30166.1 hypothetical protein DO62_752 [Burkholderia pseudomallei]KGC92371.1 hypothetical protein DP62_2702 [Burkholderia pseudomallei]KGD05150.1 hypothetical protein DO63_1986 [Burkholderia pseudomallei]KGD32658.1 hypothetical protein DO72_3531 [Burkholderia pseudomallei]